MGRTKGESNLSEAQRGEILALADANVAPKREIVNTFNCDDKTVGNILKRARQAEKENIDLYSSQAHQQHPRPGQPRKFGPRTERQLVKHATKNKYQRRKQWAVIAREIGLEAADSTINKIFYRHGYMRRAPRYKPSLTPELKHERLNFAIKYLEELEGKEHMVVYCNKTAVRVGEVRANNGLLCSLVKNTTLIT